jgi:hypothetical protein
MARQGARRPAVLVVEDEQYQRRHERVAGIDVAKASAVVCTRLPPAREGGHRASRIESVQATVPAISALGERLLADGVEMVTLESASDYWRIWFYVLEAAGLQVQLVSSTQARRLSGRPKTDPLTELPGGVLQVSGRTGVLVATVADHDHRGNRGGCAAGPFPAGNAAARVA